MKTIGHIKTFLYTSGTIVVLLASFISIRPQAAHAAAPALSKYPWSNCVYDVSVSPARYVSADQYRSYGRPHVYTTNYLSGQKVYRNITNTNEVFVRSPQDLNYCPTHHLTVSEWNYMKNPMPILQDVQYYKYASNATIYKVVQQGTPYALSYNEWLFDGQPAPQLR